MSYSISIVIPAYNEEKTISNVIALTLTALRKCFNNYEIIILNDGSSDKTGEIIQRLQENHPNIIKGIHHEQNLGIASTFEHLFTFACKDFILDLSADGQVNPTEIIPKLKPLLNQYDIIICKRNNKHYGIYRSIVSTSYRYLPKWVFGIDLHDPGCAKCTRREIRQNIQTTSTGIFKEAERCIRAVLLHSYKLTTIAINTKPHVSRRGHGAKLSLVFEATVDLTRLWLALRCNKKT